MRGAEAASAPSVVAVKLVAGQGLPGIDTGRFKADLVVTANATGRRGVISSSGSTNGTTTSIRWWIPEPSDRGPRTGTPCRLRWHWNENANVYGDVVRLVQHTSTGPRDLAGIENASLLHPDPDAWKFYDHATYGGDWRRESTFAATETMILRSRWAGSR